MAFTKTEFDAIHIGHRVGTVAGPGERAKDRTGVVTQKVEDRWGQHLVVKFDKGTDREGATDTCHGFTKVGIGWYDLEAA